MLRRLSERPAQDAAGLGRRMLFFTGGSALDSASRALKHYTHNSVHLVTPYDSGGSSAILRQAFGMPAIGDLRSRLMSLADDRATGHPEGVKLFAHRLPTDAASSALRVELDSIVRGEHALVKAVDLHNRNLICVQLAAFREAMPEDFDLRGASIGNLVLTGTWLRNARDLDSAIAEFAQYAAVLGEVHTVTNDNYHLMAQLSDGSRVLGEHRITGLDLARRGLRIERFGLSQSQEDYHPVTSLLPESRRQMIAAAQMICFPPGSFYTSVLANLLPRGAGRAIAATQVPKVFVPSLGGDPEQAGLTLTESVERLLGVLREDCGSGTPNSRLLSHVVLDSRRGRYNGGIDASALKALGVEVLERPLVSAGSAPLADAQLLVEALLSVPLQR
ncbi:GAK system CofD-like protein [Marinobacterium nitratireducens]|uniref:GAK system CofD-like protein n=1 Tax=Marinobacterium nitratireducens TaxID=518897 RepID=UPI00166A0164|nr:GAK system CofD-like protein [Marinobacterium nitratireducens]